MIRKLKRKFILLATVSMLVFMAVLVGIMNLINYSVVVSESDATLRILAQTGAPGEKPGTSPEKPPEKGERENPDAPFFPHGMSPEVPYESRFFSVTVGEDGSLLESDFSKILSVDESSAGTYVREALRGGDGGFVGAFRYRKTASADGTRLLFLDCGRKLDAFRSFLWTSLGVGLAGCLVVFFAFLLLSGRIVRPIAESYEKQKRFISDAGHEMKTPLTIINANLDLLEGEAGKEEREEIRLQTGRMTELTNGLVYLSKMEESEHPLPKVEMPLSDMIGETVTSFRAPMTAKAIHFSSEIGEGLTMNGSPDAMRHLTSVLLDNAVKYTPKGGEITVRLRQAKKNAVLLVSNTTESEMDRAALPRVFDRFYRTDASRNSETGGYGIGLSIARAIVLAHGGSIVATTDGGHDFTVTVTLPL